jgi:hypothetical protein
MDLTTNSRRERGGSADPATGGARGVGAFTLAEVMIAMGVVGLLVFANLSAMYLARMSNYRDLDKGIMSDFLQHYVEQVKGLGFSEVRTNSPINGLFNGLSGTPLITIPTSTNWFSLNTTNYQTFHPDLVWLTNRSPEIRVVLTITSVGGLEHTKHLLAEVRWRPPMGKGDLMARRLDMVRVRDL